MCFTWSSRPVGAMVVESWSRIAKKLCPQWNIFAVDLQNECEARECATNVLQHTVFRKAADGL